MNLNVYQTKDVDCYCGITHNLKLMATDAGIFSHLWRPEEIGATKASELIEGLRNGVALMKSDPERFKKHDAKNGWGTYDQFLSWVEQYLAACIKNPTANVSAPWVLLRPVGHQSGFGNLPGRMLYNVVGGPQDVSLHSTVTAETMIKRGYRVEVVL